MKKVKENMNKNTQSEMIKDSDFTQKETVDLKAAAEILGLKYHKARNVIYNDKTIGHFNFDGYKLWLKEDIIALKKKCFVNPRVA